MLCFKEDNYPSFEFTTMEYSDDGRYLAKCKRGHTTVTVLQNQKFEILFEIGANAIVDGYYREAVSSFTSSLERFYEFCIRVICKHKSVDRETYESAWKLVSNMSERQLGAFIYLWVTETNTKPTMLSDKNIKFRNGVIHKGVIPTRGEALSFGEAVLNVIKSQLQTLRAKYDQEINDVVMDYIINQRRLAVGETNGGTICEPTIVSLTSDNNCSLGDSIDGLLGKRKMYEGLEKLSGLFSTFG